MMKFWLCLFKNTEISRQRKHRGLYRVCAFHQLSGWQLLGLNSSSKTLLNVNIKNYFNMNVMALSTILPVCIFN